LVAHAIEMLFDDQADAEVRGLWQVLAGAGLPSLATRTHRRHRPHVSLTVCESLDGTDLTRLRAVLADRHPVLQLYVLGIFPGPGGVLFLGVQVTTSLLALHAEAHEALAGQPVTHWPYYLPGNWVPHCGLAQDLDSTGVVEAFRLLQGYRPITATVTSAGITDTNTGQVTPLTA
jgi:2'-5' RNA ligase superfamily protein